MRGHRLLHRGSQVRPQVPPVSHLDGVRSATTSSISVGTRPVSADCFDTGVGLEPRCEGVGVPAGEDVDGPVDRHVDDHGSVDSAAPDGEIVDPDHRRRCRLRIRQPRDHPSQGVSAGWHAERHGQPGSGAADQGQADLGQPVGQPGRYLLGERRRVTARIVAAEPAHRDLDPHRPPGDRQVSQPPAIPAMRPTRNRPAPGTGRRRCCRPHREHHHGPAGLHRVHPGSPEMRKQ